MTGPGIAKARPTAEQVEAALAERGFVEGARVLALVHGVTVADICGRGRTAAVARARRSLWLVLRDRGLSFPEIGLLFGRDHSTIVGVLRAERRKRVPEAKAS